MSLRDKFYARGRCGEVAYETLLLLQNKYPFKKMSELQYSLKGNSAFIPRHDPSLIMMNLPGTATGWVTSLNRSLEIEMSHCERIMPEYNINYGQVNLWVHIVRVVCHEWAHLLQTDHDYRLGYDWHMNENEAEEWAWNFISSNISLFESHDILSRNDLPEDFVFKDTRIIDNKDFIQKQSDVGQLEFVF